MQIEGLALKSINSAQGYIYKNVLNDKQKNTKKIKTIQKENDTFLVWH